MPCECVCACGRSWALEQDLTSFHGELALACPACGGGAVRLRLGASETATVPPDPDATVPPAFSTDDEVEPELIEDGGRLPYRILGELGRGGMGVVYRAEQVGLGRVVALKMILAGGHAGPDELARFRLEAEAIAHLRHPNIVQVYDVGEQGGLPYFSLEYCGGGSLEGRLRHRPLTPKEAARIVEVLARAMQAAHDAGIVHRDLKPANVLLADDGTPKITDFGLAKRLDEVGHGRTRTGAVVGTPPYMAPEQAAGKKDVGPPADIYALGAILYKCLTGRPPFQAATPLDTILQVLGEEPLSPRLLNSRVPRDLEVICLKCLHKEPHRRYPTARALADELQRFGAGEPIKARPPGILRRTWTTFRKRPLYAGFAVLISVGVILGVADYVRSKNVLKDFDTDEMRRVIDLLKQGEGNRPPAPAKAAPRK